MGEDIKIYDEIWEWSRRIRRIKPVEEVEQEIQKKLQTAVLPMEIIALKSELVSVLQEMKKYDAAVSTIRELIALDNNSALPHLSLAQHYLYAEERPDKALEACGLADTAARSSGHFVRHTLATKARIGIALRRHDIVEECLREIPLLKIGEGRRDVGRERDIFDRADKTQISESVLRAYEKYLQA